jgi:hypothetical protein
VGCYHIRHDFSGPAPALQDLCAELQRRTGLDFVIKIERFEVNPTTVASEGPALPSSWPTYTAVAHVQVRRSSADVDLLRAEHAIGVEFLLGGVWLRRYLETVTLDVVRRAGGRTKDRAHEEPPPWIELPWSQVPKVGLWVRAALQYALALASYIALPILLPVLVVAGAFRGRRRTKKR